MDAWTMVFDNLESGEAAREALLHDGLPADAMELTARQDEAGPVEGSFVSGNVKRDTIRATPFSANHGGVGDNSYQHNHQRVIDRGICVLVVHPRSEAHRASAQQVMRRFGARGAAP